MGLGFLRKIRDRAKNIAGGVFNVAQQIIKNKDNIVEAANIVNDTANTTARRLKPLFK